METDLHTILRSPASMAESLSHGKWKPYRHLIVLDHALMALIHRDEFDVLIVELPVRHGKSKLCSRWLPAWYLARWPDRTVAVASYGADFAAKWGREAREVFTEFGEMLGVELDPGSSANARWDLAGTGGGMWTAGVGGPIVGKGYHLGIIDDPVKNEKDARSETMREATWDWWQGTWLTREEPGVKRVIVMSRWHNDDLVGRLENNPEGLRLRRLRLPALAEEADPMGRDEGEALCPERYDQAKLERFRQSRGPNIWAAQYQQRPIAEGGQILDPNLVGGFRAIDGGVQLTTGQRWSLQQLRCFTTVDLAMTAKTTADYSVAMTFFVTPEGFLLIRDVSRVRHTSEEHVSWLHAIQHRLRPQWIGIEEGLLGTATLAAAIRSGLKARPLKHGGRDKVTRAEDARTMLMLQRVYALESAPWLEKFLREIGEFDKGRYDDQVDAFAYGCDVVLRGLKGKRPRRDAATDLGVTHREEFGRAKRRVLHPTMGRL